MNAYLRNRLAELVQVMVAEGNITTYTIELADGSKIAMDADGDSE